MSEIFHPQLKLAQVMDTLDVHGGAFVPESLCSGFRKALHEEVALLPAQLHIATGNRTVHEHYYRVKQLGRSNFSPRVLELADQLAWQIRLAMGRRVQLSQWLSNDVEVHLYDEQNLGITPHRDFSDNHLLIVSFTLAGYGQFEYHGEEQTDDPTLWETGPGSLILLQAKGFNPRKDFRPVHAVRGPVSGFRTSIIFWMSERTAD